MLSTRLMVLVLCLSASCAAPRPNASFPVRSDAAPAALGPYSQAKGVRLQSDRSLVFLSGQVGIDPTNGKFAEGGIVPETRQVLKNLRAVLEASGSSMSDILTATVYLMDMADYETFNRVYAEAFADVPPSRVCVQVAALPKGARVEISCIALGR